VRHQEEADFRSYVTARAPALRRTAHLLSGDWHAAEDLVQVTLTKLYLNWRKVRHANSLDGYARQVLVRVYLDDQRKRRRESPAERLPELAVSGPEHTGDRELLLAALAQVPPRQRAVLVLRFWEDQSVQATAQLLGCSEGNVKSQTARGLDALRRLLPTHP
jgi:RNA polymerase sigma-70 factor (sigma-E family)